MFLSNSLVAISLGAVHNISHRENVLPQTFPIKLSLVVSKYSHISFWKYFQETLIKLSIIKVAKGPFSTFCDIEISKVDRLAPRNTLHVARNRLYELRDI